MSRLRKRTAARLSTSRGKMGAIGRLSGMGRSSKSVDFSAEEDDVPRG